MALCLVAEDGSKGGVSAPCQLGEEVLIGRADLDKSDAKLSKTILRLAAKTGREAVVTRVGRTPVYVVPKGETGRLELSKEGADNGREKSSERMYLGDQVVVTGTRKMTMVLLPEGKTWFEWASQNREREELRLMELKELGKQQLSTEEEERKQELLKKVAAWDAEDREQRAAAAAATAAAAAATAAAAAAAAAA
eukprot:CAMPEP_0181330518 /NCGR_PEP_ID=MMETSP1101-20121128/23942_1 /TAXON_ID=46948 /ORGANISM="Rhodomonas abbreviata, Strain Caron Lab Isolate" /LENGTH=194 /DNA_ID=CAMNT_0023439779 /DNA_START=159 /DNA_END=739 /DNA_ORIENTATION=+